MRNVKVIGAEMTAFGKHLDRSLGSLACEAVAGSLADAGLPPREVGFVAFGNAAAGVLTGQEMIRAQTALSGSGLEGAPMVNVENACASASSAFHLAWLAVAGGQCEVALAVGAEKMYHPTDKSRPAAALSRGVDVAPLVEKHGEEVLSKGLGPMFMELYAKMARRYMEENGATQRHFAMVAAKNHNHGSRNPKAQNGHAYTVEEVLASRDVADPLRLLMCSPVSDGAAALVLCSETFAKKHGGQTADVLACVMKSGNARSDDAVESLTSSAAFEESGVDPKDIDVLEVHDAASPGELVILEALGVVKKGEAIPMLEAGETSLGGTIPTNPSGGLVAKGHPIGATGCAQLVELSGQLRERCGERQVAGARLALAENAGGWLGKGLASCVVTILGAS